MHWSLLVPAPWNTVSGGYVYDRAVVAGAREAGHRVDVVELAGCHPLPDAEATGAARSAWESLPHTALPVIDGLGLPAFAPLAEQLVARGAAALVHHPTALETGRDPGARERLRAIECDLLPRLRRIVVTSDDTRNRLVNAFGTAADRIRVVVPGTADAPRSAGPLQQAGCAILTIGTLLPRKGHDVLLRALARLPDLDWRLTIVGAPRDADYAASLRLLAVELGIAPRVTFAGETTGQRLDSLWQEAGLFALATHYEGYGMVVAEALRRGIPLAVTAGGAVEQLVTPETGVLAAPGDHVALSNAMRRQIFDAGLRHAMADAAWALGRGLPDWQLQAALFVASLAD